MFVPALLVMWTLSAFLVSSTSLSPSFMTVGTSTLPMVLTMEGTFMPVRQRYLTLPFFIMLKYALL